MTAPKLTEAQYRAAYEALSPFKWQEVSPQVQLQFQRNYETIAPHLQYPSEAAQEPTASHLVRDGQTLCGLDKWEEGDIDIKLSIEKGIANCAPCLRKAFLEMRVLPYESSTVVTINTPPTCGHYWCLKEGADGIVCDWCGVLIESPAAPIQPQEPRYTLDEIEAAILAQSNTDGGRLEFARAIRARLSPAPPDRAPEERVTVRRVAGSGVGVFDGDKQQGPCFLTHEDAQRYRTGLIAELKADAKTDGRDGSK